MVGIEILGAQMVLGGLMNLFVSTVNGRRGREHSAELQAKQQEFTTALQREQREDTARLQHELRELAAKETRENQKKLLEHQKAMMVAQSAVSSWPFNSNPLLLAESFAKALENDQKVPLQLYFFSDSSLQKSQFQTVLKKLGEAGNEVSGILNTYFNSCSSYPVQFFTECLKPNTPFGSTQVYNAHNFSSAAPTMLIWCREHEGNLIIDCAFWGIAGFINPQFGRLLKIDLQEFQIERMRFLSRNPKSQYLLSENDYKALMKTVELEKQKIAEKTQKAISDDEYQLFIYPEIQKAYNKLLQPCAAMLSKELSSAIQSLLKVSATLLTDVHYLLSEQKEPVFPSICKNDIESLPGAKDLFQRFFIGLESSTLLPSQKSLIYAKVANSYFKVDVDEAEIFAAESVKQLEYCTGILDEYSSTSRDILRHLSLPATRKLPELSRPEEVRHEESSDVKNELDFYECGLRAYEKKKYAEAEKFWIEAACCGKNSALLQLAQLYEMRYETEKAYTLYFRLIKCGADIGYLEKAYTLAEAFLQHNRTDDAMECIIYCLAHLSSVDQVADALFMAAIVMISTYPPRDVVLTRRWQHLLLQFFDDLNDKLPSDGFARETLYRLAEMQHQKTLSFVRKWFMVEKPSKVMGNGMPWNFGGLVVSMKKIFISEFGLSLRSEVFDDDTVARLRMYI